ncbi:MAG: hypothetical protein AMXMBFR56_12940 [Polyangiaceae bacterium]
MLRALSLSLFVATGLFVFACGSADSSGSNPNCSNNSCSACANCYELCVCTTGDTAQCAPACGMSSTGGAPGGGGAPAGGAGGGPSGGSGGGGGTISSGGLATGLSITEISLYQAVKVPLMQNWSEPARNAPIIVDREGVFRVFVNPESGYQAREIIARVELAGGATGSFDGKAYIGGPSSDTDPNSTIQVSIPPGTIKPNTTYTVSLLEAAQGQSFPGASDKAKYGAVNLGAQGSGVFNVMLVPIVINGITPVTGPSEVQAYHDRLFKLYPAHEVNVEVRAPATYGGSAPQAKSISGWNQLLNWLMQLRSNDKPPANYYYYGVFTPATSFAAFCGGACIAGLSNTPYNQPNDVLSRSSIGLGFFPSGGNPSSSDTMAHEVGHALGLFHAPCQTQDADPQFPYSGGGIGTWGWDIFTKNFLEPSKYKDIMGYCDPTWTADWTFNKMYKRISYVNGAGDVAVPTDPERAPGRFNTAIIADDGTLSWGTPIDTPWPVLTDERTVEILDAAGKVIGKVKGFAYPVGHDGKTTFLLIRDKGAFAPNAAAIKPAGSPVSLAL